MTKHVAAAEPIPTPPIADAAESERLAEAKQRQAQSHKIIRRNVYWALGAGLVPVPVADLLAMTGVQVKMLKELSDLYQVKFFEEKAKTTIGSLVAGLGSLSLAGAVAGSLFKVVPVLGQVVGFIGVPLMAGALTMAVGNVFAMHYESGGTLLDFDAVKMRKYFTKEYENAKTHVQEMRKEAKHAAE